MIQHPELAVEPLRTPTLPPATHTNCYLLGEQRLTVVDPASPWPEERARIARLLDERVAQGAVVQRVLLTHHHLDHVGGAVALSEHLGAPIAAHPRTAELLEGSVPVTEFIEEGERVHTDRGAWRALHTPGHASGHLCLHHEQSRAVVAGDMVAGVGTIVLEPPEGVLAQYLSSLQRLLDLNCAVLFPAHGPAIRQPAALLKHYIQHRHKRTGQVRAALQASPRSTPLQLVPAIYGDTIPKMVYPLAARQVLCHLQWLAERDEVRSLESGRWSPVGAR